MMTTTEDMMMTTNYEASLPLFVALSWMVMNTLTATNKTNTLVHKQTQTLT